MSELLKKYLRGIKQISKYYIINSKDLEFISSALLVKNVKILLIGPPEAGKTTLIRIISKLLNASYARITGDPRRTIEQTLLRPDTKKLLKGEIEYIIHPIITSQVKFFNEINRFSREVQDALLSLLEEGFIEREGRIYKTSEYIAFADMNPYRGDIDLALKSRFDYSLYLSSILSDTDSYKIIELLNEKNFLDSYITPTISFSELLELQNEVSKIKISRVLVYFAQAAILDFFGCIQVDKNLISIPILQCDKCNFKTGPCRYIKHSGGFRTLLSVIKLAKARAYIRGRKQVELEDIIFSLRYSLPHRFEFFEEYETSHYNPQSFVDMYISMNKSRYLEYLHVLSNMNSPENYIKAQQLNSLGIYILISKSQNVFSLNDQIEQYIKQFNSNFTVNLFDKASEIIAHYEEGSLSFVSSNLIDKLKDLIDKSILVVSYNKFMRNKDKVKEILQLDDRINFISRNLAFNYETETCRIIRSVSTITIIASPQKINLLKGILS